MRLTPLQRLTLNAMMFIGGLAELFLHGAGWILGSWLAGVALAQMPCWSTDDSDTPSDPDGDTGFQS